MADLCKASGCGEVRETCSDYCSKHGVPDKNERLLAAMVEIRDLMANAYGNSSFHPRVAKMAQAAIEAFKAAPSATGDIEQAWQMLEACGVPRERARNNLARGIEVLSSRLAKEEWFQRAMEADATRYRWLRVRGCAIDGTDAQRDGLVRRCVNLDEEIDKLASTDGSTAK